MIMIIRLEGRREEDGGGEGRERKGFYRDEEQTRALIFSNDGF